MRLMAENKYLKEIMRVQGSHLKGILEMQQGALDGDRIVATPLKIACDTTSQPIASKKHKTSKIEFGINYTKDDVEQMFKMKQAPEAKKEE